MVARERVAESDPRSFAFNGVIVLDAVAVDLHVSSHMQAAV
jgi:hypothetical protein